MLWYVYLIRCSDNSIYTGVTTNVERRFLEHLHSPGKKGARYFLGRQPEQVIYTEQHSDRASAQRRECAVKRLTRQQKLNLARL